MGRTRFGVGGVASSRLKWNPKGKDMAAVPEHRRLDDLHRIGASAALIRLSIGEVVHEAFRYSCLGPPFYVYHQAGTPVGPPLVPLWDCNDTVVGMWERPDGPEFIEFSIESHDEYHSLSRTEQGFWATQFSFFFECDMTFGELREAASAVGFRFLELLLTSRVDAESGFVGPDDCAMWLRSLVERIDRESRLAGFPTR